MKDDGPFVLPLMRVDCQLTAGDQIFRLHMDVQGGRKRASSSQPSPIDGSIKQRLAAGHHEGSTGTGASGRFRSTRTACTPFKITTATGKEKKPNATITPHRTRTTLHISIRMQGNYCPNRILINSLGAQRRQEREALACCSSPLPLLLPVVRPRAFMRGPALPAPRDILLHQPSAAMNLAWDSRLA